MTDPFRPRKEAEDLKDDLRELIEEWREVSEWGDRDNMIAYQKGLKDATKDKANELEGVLDNHE